MWNGLFDRDVDVDVDIEVDPGVYGGSDGDVDIDEKQFGGDSTLIDGLEEPATDTVNMFRAKESAVSCPKRFRRAATRRRARGDNSNRIVG